MDKLELFKRIELISNDSLDLSLVLLLNDYVQNMNWEELSSLDRYLILRDSQISCEQKIKRSMLFGNKERTEYLLSLKKSIDMNLEVVLKHLYEQAETEHRSMK